MKYILIIILAIMLTSCSVRREIIMPDKTIYTVRAQKDDLITFKLSKDGDVELTCDGRGRPGMFEKVLNLLFLSLPDVEVGTGD